MLYGEEQSTGGELLAPLLNKPHHTPTVQDHLQSEEQELSLKGSVLSE